MPPSDPRKRTGNPVLCPLNSSSVQSLSRVQLFATLWTAARRPPYPSPTPGVYSNSCPLDGDAIQPSHPLSSPSPPTFNLSQHQGLFKWVSSICNERLGFGGAEIATGIIWALSCSVVSNSLQSQGLSPTKLLCPWNFPGNNTRVSCPFLLQGIFPTQRSNCASFISYIGRWILYQCGILS